jgi:hypothetical protein
LRRTKAQAQTGDWAFIDLRRADAEKLNRATWSNRRSKKIERLALTGNPRKTGELSGKRRSKKSTTCVNRRREKKPSELSGKRRSKKSNDLR